METVRVIQVQEQDGAILKCMRCDLKPDVRITPVTFEDYDDLYCAGCYNDVIDELHRDLNVCYD